MARNKKDQDSFFIGWGETPKADRRFLLLASLGLLSAAAGGAALIASKQAPPGDGTWNPNDERDWAGQFVRAPYPMLRTRAIDGTPRTAYLVSSNKRGVQHRLGTAADGPVIVHGSLLLRGANAMIAVADDNWMHPAVSDSAVGEGLSGWQAVDGGEARYAGEILDSKCWFGAMQPGQGKPHKACAALCIQGGLPPVFCPEGLCGSGASAPLLTDAAGNPHGPDLIEFVADPVVASGRLVQIGDVRQFRVALNDIKRI